MTQPLEPFVVSDALWAKCAPLIEQRDPESLRDGRRLLELLISESVIGHSAGEVEGYRLSVRALRERWRARGLLDLLSTTILLRLDDA